MMTCRELVERLIDIVSGELSPEQRHHVEQHLRGCPPCAAYLESYRLTLTVTRQLRHCALPPRLVRLLQALLQENGNMPSATAAQVGAHDDRPDVASGHLPSDRPT